MTPIDAADGLDREDCMQTRPVAQRRQGSGLWAGKDTPADQPAMAVIEGIGDGSQRSTPLEAVRVEMVLHSLMGVTMVGLEYQEIVRLAIQNSLGNVLLSAHGNDGYQGVLQCQRLK